MAVNIVTGMTGTAHITSDDDRCFNASILGTGKYVFDYGQKFSADIINNNLIRIHEGMCINQGTQMGIELNDYEDVIIENGVSGSNRNDLIVMRYERDAGTSIEKASLVVIKGTAGATDPSYISGNILDGGDLIDDMPLFRVKIESLTITAVEKLFKEYPLGGSPGGSGSPGGGDSSGDGSLSVSYDAEQEMLIFESGAGSGGSSSSGLSNNEISISSFSMGSFNDKSMNVTLTEVTE